VSIVFRGNIISEVLKLYSFYYNKLRQKTENTLGGNNKGMKKTKYKV